MAKTKEQVSYNMSRILSKGSLIEKTLGKALWTAGLRYRKHYKKLPGIPDFALVKYKIAIFSGSKTLKAGRVPNHYPFINKLD